MVAIKDFEMPKSCNECSFHEESDYGDYCEILCKDILNYEKRKSDCPLVEINEVKDDKTNI